jgi:hypothetical protein
MTCLSKGSAGSDHCGPEFQLAIFETYEGAGAFMITASLGTPTSLVYEGAVGASRVQYFLGRFPF